MHSGERLWQSALLEHYRSHFLGEWLYRKELSSSSPEPRILDAMLKEFRVARTISASGKLTLLKNLEDWSLSRTDEAEWQKIIIHSQTLGPQNKKTKSLFVSGMSKVLWFSGGHDYPMFDRFTSRALRTGYGGKAIERARKFYTALDNHNYRTARDRLASIVCQPGNRDTFLYWASPARVIDKFLMFKGDSKSELLLSNEAILEKTLRHLEGGLRKKIEGAAKTISDLGLESDEYALLLP